MTGEDGENETSSDRNRSYCCCFGDNFFPPPQWWVLWKVQKTMKLMWVCIAYWCFALFLIYMDTRHFIEPVVNSEKDQWDMCACRFRP